MKKKRYLKPTVKVYDIKQPTVLLGGSPTEFGQLPTIPGGGENRKDVREGAFGLRGGTVGNRARGGVDWELAGNQDECAGINGLRIGSDGGGGRWCGDGGHGAKQWLVVSGWWLVVGG